MGQTRSAAARDAGPKLVSMHDIDGSFSPSAQDSASEPLSATAYAVLGILSVTDEELTPGEIRLRAEFAFRHFYWSPAVSHIRRELRRLVEMGLAAEREIAIGQVRRSQVYQTTAEGEVGPELDLPRRQLLIVDRQDAEHGVRGRRQWLTR